MDKVAMMIAARKIVKQVDDLPTIPEITERVIMMLNDPVSEPDQIADLILSDQVLASRVIRAVNSPLYGHNTEITSVKRGLLYIGFAKIKEMILINSFIDSFKDHRSPFDMKNFWLHSFTVGAYSKRISELIGYRDVEKAYMVGIIHDIGKVFFGHYHRAEYAEMLLAIKGKPYTTYEAEMEVFGTSHCEIGLCLAQRWDFPASYCDGISYHHTSELATVDPLLTSIVSMADFYSLMHSPVDGVAQAVSLGRSEEHSWSVIKQLSKKTLQGSLESFLHLLDGGGSDESSNVDTVLKIMVEK